MIYSFGRFYFCSKDWPAAPIECYLRKFSSNIFLLGWETDCAKGKSPAHILNKGIISLKKLDLQILPQEECHTWEGYFNQWNETRRQCRKNFYSLVDGWVVKEGKVKDHVMCAENPKKGQDTCIGNSGGPVTVKHWSGPHTLVGVTADGFGCGVVSFVHNPGKCGEHF